MDAIIENLPGLLMAGMLILGGLARLVTNRAKASEINIEDRRAELTQTQTDAAKDELLLEHLKDLRLTVEKTSEQIARLTSDNLELTARLTVLTSDKKQVDEKMVRAGHQIDELNKKVDQLQTDNASLHKQLDESTSKIEQLQSDVVMYRYKYEGALELARSFGFSIKGAMKNVKQTDSVITADVDRDDDDPADQPSTGSDRNG